MRDTVDCIWRNMIKQAEKKRTDLAEASSL